MMMMMQGFACYDGPSVRRIRMRSLSGDHGLDVCVKDRMRAEYASHNNVTSI